MTTEPSRHLTAILRIYSHRAGLLIVLAAALVLVGWGTDQEILKSLMPGRVPMNPVTAIGFILMGFTLWSLRHERMRQGLQWIGTGCAVVALVLALLRVVDELPRVETSVDLWLFPSKLGKARMAPNTAVCFLLTGAALLLRDRPRRWAYSLSVLAALLAGCVALMAVTGYVYDVEAFSGPLAGYVPMAVNTAILFLILSLGILCGCPDREPLRTLLSDTDGGFMVRRLLPAAFFIPIVIGMALLMGEKSGRYDTPFLVTLYTLSTTIVFVSLIWGVARLLHRVDMQRARTEERLRESEAIFHSLVETLPQNIFRKDLAGRFTFGNRNFCRELGRPIEQIIGRTDYEFFSHELADRYREDDRHVVGTGESIDVVEEHVTPAGEKLYVQVMKTPVRDPEGRILGTQGIFWNVTARKLAEQELERKNKQLEEAIQSLRQAQSQLVQSEKLASLGQMVAGVAHEINNPLAFVSNNVVVLQRDVKALAEVVALYKQADETIQREQKELWREISELCERVDLTYTLENLTDLFTRSRDGLKRIQQIVKDLRDFARLDESDLHEVDLNEGIRSTVNIIRGSAKRHHVQIEMELGELPMVTCYPAKINQVIMNLLSNAIDASRDDGKIFVRSRAKGRHVELEVQDQGSGIPPEVRERIFDPFFTTKPPGQGTGLGLSISYGIVQTHGGTIHVESEVGRGTTFTVTLPLKPPKVKVEPVREAAAV